MTVISAQGAKGSQTCIGYCCAGLCTAENFGPILLLCRRDIRSLLISPRNLRFRTCRQTASIRKDRNDAVNERDSAGGDLAERNRKRTALHMLRKHPSTSCRAHPSRAARVSWARRVSPKESWFMAQALAPRRVLELALPQCAPTCSSRALGGES